MAGHPTPRIALGLIAAAAVAGCAWLLLFHQSDEDSRRRAGAGRATPGTPESRSPAAASRAAAAPSNVAAAEAADTLTRATGVPGARRESATAAGGSLSTDPAGGSSADRESPDTSWIVAALADLDAAADAEDLARIAEVEARLSAWLNGDEDRALALVTLMRGDLGPEALALIAGILSADAGASGSPAVADALLSLAADAGATTGQREHALRALAESTAETPGITGRLAALAHDGGPHVAEAALAALSSRAGRSSALRDETFQPLMEALAAQRSPELRGALVAGLALEDASHSQVENVARLLSDDADPDVRASAASALGGAAGPARDDAVEALVRAFRADGAIATRQAVLLSLVRLLGGRAREPIAGLRAVAGAARADVDDYLAILAEGETQADRIVRRKQERELARGELPGGSHEHHD